MQVGEGQPLFVIAGPDVIESRGARCCATRTLLREICDAARRPFVFKCSYDKANRTSGKSFRGSGPGRRACEFLGRVKGECRVAILTDVHEAGAGRRRPPRWRTSFRYPPSSAGRRTWWSRWPGPAVE